MPDHLSRLIRPIFDALVGPQTVLACSAMLLTTYWLGGEVALITMALGLPVFAMGAALMHARGGFDPQVTAREVLDKTWEKTATGGLKSAVFVVHFDRSEEMQSRIDARTQKIVAQRLAERVRSALRMGDFVTDVPGGLLVVLHPRAGIDLEACIQLSARMQTAAEEPVVANGATFWPSICVGFCLRSRASGPDSGSWRAAALTALTEAQRIGPGTIRGYNAEMRAARDWSNELTEEIAEALEAGQVQPFFQPQISTETGRVSGFEALARWKHSGRGMLLPEQFLPAVEAVGLSERLSEVILYHSLTALKAWDAAGAKVPTVGVNLSDAELQNPRIAEKIAWELDRFDLHPGRLALEVSEKTLTNAPSDMVCRNIDSLEQLGCRIDLDDFGTGSASIAAIRQFRIGRIKIDNCFINRSDRDPEQQRLISAVLTMAERLQVRTLGKGIKSVGEHALLAQLGCDEVQGLGISKPLPFEQTLTWMKVHDAKLKDPPEIGLGSATYRPGKKSG